LQLQRVRTDRGLRALRLRLRANFRELLSRRKLRGVIHSPWIRTMVSGVVGSGVPFSVMGTS